MVVLGIDLGAAASVVAAVGRGGVVIVRNDLGDRLTATVATYTKTERLLGENSVSLLRSSAPDSIRYFTHALALASTPAGDGSCPVTLEEENKYALAPLVTAPTSGAASVSYKVASRSELIHPVSVLAGYIDSLIRSANNALESPVTAVVVGVPSWFSVKDRAAVQTACAIARVQCLRVMDACLATALDYGLFRSASFSADRPATVGFVDVGQADASVAVVRYLPSKLEVLAAATSPRLGGRALDAILYNHCLHEFATKTAQIPHNKVDSFKVNPRMRMKLEEAVGKVKKSLSMSTEALVGIEYFYEDLDLNVVISRETFEKLAAGYNSELKHFIDNVVREASTAVCAPDSSASVEASDAASGNGSPAPTAGSAASAGSAATPFAIDSVEINGGIVRIPFVAQLIQHAFNLPLSRTLNADESVARGCAIQAAMLDVRHRVKEFRIVERLTTPVALRLTSPTSPTSQTAGCSPPITPSVRITNDLEKGDEVVRETATGAIELFPRGLAYAAPFVKWVSLENVSQILNGASAVQVALSDAETDRPQITYQIDLSKTTFATPTHTGEASLTGENTTDAVPEMIGDYKVPPPKLKMSFTLDLNQTIALKAYEYRVVPDTYKERVPKAGGAAGEYEDVERLKPKLVKYKLPVSVAACAYSFPAETLQTLTAVETAQAKVDEEIAGARKLRNDILALAFRVREVLEPGSGSHHAHLESEAERAQIIAASHEAESFAETNVNLTLAEYRAEMEKLEGVFERVDKCFRDQQERERLERERKEQERIALIEEAKREAERQAREAAAAEAAAAQAGDAMSGDAIPGEANPGEAVPGEAGDGEAGDGGADEGKGSLSGSSGSPGSSAGNGAATAAGDGSAGTPSPQSRKGGKAGASDMGDSATPAATMATPSETPLNGDVKSGSRNASRTC